MIVFLQLIFYCFTTAIAYWIRAGSTYWGFQEMGQSLKNCIQIWYIFFKRARMIWETMYPLTLFKVKIGGYSKEISFSQNWTCCIQSLESEPVKINLKLDCQAENWITGNFNLIAHDCKLETNAKILVCSRDGWRVSLDNVFRTLLKVSVNILQVN